MVADFLTQCSTDIFGDRIDSHPLWFKNDSFLQHNFDSESHIADLRSLVPLDHLRSDLQSHLSSLKHELVELVNHDYADFVDLTTKLGDVDGAVVRMRVPLAELRGKILLFRDSAEDSLAAMRDRLRQRGEASSAREILELLLDTCHVVSKVEKLIKELTSVPTDWSNGDVDSAEKSYLSNGSDEGGTNRRETQSMLLERIASEMNRIKFYIAHAQNLPFIENMEKRIQAASLLLDASLGHCFLDGLEHRDENAIYNCLRAYAAIDNTTGAEQIFRTTVVSPLVEKIIPQSFSQAVTGELGDDLEGDYQRIIRCIENDCRFLLEISSSEVLSAIRKGKPGVFSPGRPTEFLKNYKSSLTFLAYLEDSAGLSELSQEIAGALDSALTATTLTPVQNSHSNHGSLELTLKQSVTLLESLRSCWSDDVLVISCADKFLRVSLQLLSRYSTWLSTGLDARKMGNAGSNPGTEWALSAVPEDFIYVLHDINFLVTELRGDYLRSILQLLFSCSTEILDLVKQSILQGGESLKTVVPQVMKTLIQSLVEKSVEDMQQLKGISATYWMGNKPLPVRHSPYVSGILSPLKARIRESSLQRFRQGALRRAGASSDVTDNNVSNAFKICMQLFLDVQEYGRNLATLGVPPANIPAFCSLWQCVAPPDRQNEINI